MKNIYLQQDEEIISIIDKLVQSEENAVNLFIPSGAQIWQSSINLKLLKREVDYSKKDVNLIVSDDLGAEMAKRIGFAVQKEADFPVEMIKEENNEIEVEEMEIEQEQEEKKEIKFEEIPEQEIEPKVELEESEVELEEPAEKIEKEENVDKSDMIDFLVSELKSEDSEDKTITPVVANSEETKKKMADIVNPYKNVEPKLFENRFFKKSPKKKIIKKKIERKEVKISKKPEQDVFLNNEIEFENNNNNIEDNVPAKSFKWAKFLIFFVIIAFLMVGLVCYLVLPKADIVIYPKYDNMSFDLSFVGSKDISQVDVSLNKIPIQEIEVSKTASKEFESTGEKRLNEKARGFITVYNEYSSSSQVLVATTRFESSNGKVFRILDQITIPGAKISEGKIIGSSMEVEVFADESGESYNIDSSSFTIPGFKGSPKYAGFYAESNSPMTGGSTGKVKVVSAEDLKKAKENLSEEIRNEVKLAFEEQIPTDLKTIESSLDEEIIIISTVKEGAKTDKFTLEIKAIIKALLFKEKDIKNLIDLNIISMISEGKEPLSETQKIQWGEPVIDDENNEILFDLNVEENIAWKIDTNSLKENLLGLDEIEVRKYLSNQIKIQESKVSFWPFWVKQIPEQKEKIEIIIDCKN